MWRKNRRPQGDDFFSTIRRKVKKQTLSLVPDQSSEICGAARPRGDGGGKGGPKPRPGGDDGRGWRLATPEEGAVINSARIWDPANDAEEDSLINRARTEKARAVLIPTWAPGTLSAVPLQRPRRKP